MHRLLPILLSALIAAPAPASIPLFAHLSTERAPLESYAVPLHVDVTLHKWISFRFGMNGMVYFKEPARLKLEMRSVPEQYQRLFADLGTPRTWPQTYDLQVLDETIVGGRKTYRLVGTPRRPNQVDHMIVEMTDETAPITAQWFLHDGGTIRARIETASVSSHLVPTREQADINVNGYKIHADMRYGEYELNSQTADAAF